MKRKYSYQKTADFFSQEENFDVLFFGSSHTIDGIFPMELWKDYGIVSYNLGNYSERIATTYYNMLLALEQSNPQLIVIDACFIENMEKIREDKKEHLYNMLDSYPISYTKYIAIKDLFNNENVLDNEINFLFNFSLYHSRWNELTEEDFRLEKNKEKGAETMINVSVPNKTSNFNDINVYNKKETVNMEYLRKIINYCQENEIEILITYLPYPATDEDIGASKYVQKNMR